MIRPHHAMAIPESAPAAVYSPTHTGLESVKYRKQANIWRLTNRKLFSIPTNQPSQRPICCEQYRIAVSGSRQLDCYVLRIHHSVLTRSLLPTGAMLLLYTRLMAAGRYCFQSLVWSKLGIGSARTPSSLTVNVRQSHAFLYFGLDPCVWRRTFCGVW